MYNLISKIGGLSAIRPTFNSTLTAVVRILLLGIAVTGINPVYASAQPTITLIIDDLGYNLRNGMRAINLPGTISYAILPHTPFSKRLARSAYEKGKTVMLHAPMTNIHQKEPGPGTLSPDMDQARFRQELDKALAAVPFVQGINNHMGSELTQDATRMGWLMKEVEQRRLFFIDSKTTAASVAGNVAAEAGVPTMSRDVFLDHIRTPEAVNAAFDSLIRKARQRGHAVGIGHPHSVTLAMLEQRLPTLQKEGIRLISVPSQLVALGQTYTDNAPQIAVQELPPAVSALIAQLDVVGPAVTVKRDAPAGTPRTPTVQQVIRHDIVVRKPDADTRREVIIRKRLVADEYGLAGPRQDAVQPQRELTDELYRSDITTPAAKYPDELIPKE